ncbi:MAG: HAD family hydrolase [Acidobacteriota bacterium]|nr:MAG: HAD family hydrolase [Acidobacteriota bacterium]
MESLKANTSTSKVSSSRIGILKELLATKDSAFWQRLAEFSNECHSFSEIIKLSNLRKRANTIDFGPNQGTPHEEFRIAVVGGSTLYPLSELIEHLLAIEKGNVKLHLGNYNNYRAEITDPESELYGFDPEIVVVLPDETTCKYAGDLTDSAEAIATEVERYANETLSLCNLIRQRSSAEIILCNFGPSPYFDLGQLGTKHPASDWNFKRSVNLALAELAPNFVHICDLEFLAYRTGGLVARDESSWFESKQLLSPVLQVVLAREISHIVCSLKRASKKVLVLDLDNTIWGGVIGDDGLEGIELGDTSPRGEAFKAFQAYVQSLTERGVVLAVCSKNDFENAIEPFRKHPEMVLREEDIVSFKANWDPKPDNLARISDELKLGLDSFVFVDDNPAEIEIVRQFTPDVTALLLNPDPSQFVPQLKESRLFEVASISIEDRSKTLQYRKEAERRNLLETSVDMDSFLGSLQMKGTVKDFDRLDLPRIGQLINKSNQFNLTTRRRTESEVERIIEDPDFTGFTMRLSDKFGDHGLISVVIGKRDGETLEVDTWLMSCRVLKRQVEEAVMNELVARARDFGCSRIKGVYLPTAKNGMVKRHYPDLGFSTIREDDEAGEYELSVDGFEPRPTFIAIESTHAKL